MFRSHMVHWLIGIALGGAFCPLVQAQEVHWRPGTGRPGVPFTITPTNPTTADIISFWDPRDEHIYSNLCTAETMVGMPSLIRNDSLHRIDVGFLPRIGSCTTELNPVSGLEGSFFHLSAGDWTYSSQAGVEHHFTVSAVPEPSTFALMAVAVIAGIRRRSISARRA